MRHRNILTTILLSATFILAAQSNDNFFYINSTSNGDMAFKQGDYSEVMTYYVTDMQSAEGNPTTAPQKIFFCDATVNVKNDSAEAKQKENIETQTNDNAEDPIKIKGFLEFTVNGVTFKMIYVEGGTFTMGCTSESDSDCEEDEKPAHKVTLTDFYMGETEVTVELFKAFISETGYQTEAEKEGYAWRRKEVDGKWDWRKIEGLNWMYDGQGNRRNQMEDDHPVLYVSWNDATMFCKWLKRKTGKNFQLPTEAQWEYAARGGNNSKSYKYSGSNTANEVAWYVENSRGTTHPVKTKLPNEIGLYDMSGNVWEWCSDWYGNYDSSAQTNPQGPSSGSRHILRGGSWWNYADPCQVSVRLDNAPWHRFSIAGFRLAIVF